MSSRRRSIAAEGWVGRLFCIATARQLTTSLGLLWAMATGTVWASAMNAAFYYGPAPLPPELRIFDAWVVEPANIGDSMFIQKHQDKLFAYVSVGEVTPGRHYSAKMPAAWLRGENRAWQSQVIDQAAPGWPEFFVDQIVAPLHGQGFRHFFLDTLDSYRLFADTPETRAQQERGLVRAIQRLKGRYPEARLIVNRGFELLPQISELVAAVAAESLFQSWDNATRQYLPVPGHDREWLMTELLRVRDQYRLPVIVIDYVSPADRPKARDTARKIRDLGFVPWVSNGNLDMVGIGGIEVLPRRVLMLHDSKVEGAALRYSDIHRHAAMPLNYLGYVPEYLDVSQAGLPEGPLAGRFAGIVTWFHSSETTAGTALGDWLVKQAADGMSIGVLGYFGFELSGKMQGQLGLKRNSQVRKGWTTPVRVVSRKATAAFEMEPLPEPDEFFPLDAGKTADVWLRTSDGVAEQHAVAITRWGGYALAPFTVSMLFDKEQARWVIDPIAFFRSALRLPDMPVPDVTTENGRRLLVTHIDGDGFASKAEFGGRKWVAEVLYEEILRRYPVPTTFSIIEGETSPSGRYPELSPHLEPIARKIFALPHVEAASHSYSHPFQWERMADGAADKYSLGIPGYVFDESREIEGSVAYVNSLLPAGKRCRVFLWTGNCRPGSSVLGRTHAAGLLNMNGGETLISRTNPSLTAVGPLGIAVGEHFQVFAPNQNENVYTNLWTGPFYGYERAIETFELTERPLRLKPINIYYHTYSASKAGSLKALRKVYDWALKQPVLPIFGSTYIRKVVDFNELAIARDGEGWRIIGGNEVRTLRVPKRMGFPDMGRSEGVLGWWDEDDVRYIHLDGGPSSLLVMGGKQSGQARLARANGRVARVSGGWKVEGSRPLELQFAEAEKCHFLVNGNPVVARAAGRYLAVKHPGHSAIVEAHCGQ
jgi:polysaccharide biosynthesis protein PelA